MKKRLILLVLLLPLIACAHQKQNIIFETDMGNDVDDALALRMLYNYQKEGKVNLLAISINKNGTSPVEFTDIMNTWYGFKRIPIGKITNGAVCENDAVNYATKVCEMKNAKGKPRFKRSVKDYSNIPEATDLYRKIIAKQADQSVTIISTGFSTNLQRLLQTKGDSYSPLTGVELVQKKVKRLVMMGGSFVGNHNPEYNILKDVSAASAVFSNWPTAIVTSPFEVGADILFPGSVIENIGVTTNPMAAAYASYLKMPYDRPTWDLTAVLYAVEGASFFGLSPKGEISVDREGSTFFAPKEGGNCQYLTATREQKRRILLKFLELISPKLYARHDHSAEGMLRIASYNILNGKKLDHRTPSFAEQANIIGNLRPDAIAIEEVDSMTRRSAGHFVLGEYGAQLQMHALYSPAINYDGGKYGMGILTREQPIKVTRIPLPGREEMRTCIIAEFPNYVFCGTHFSLTEEDRLTSIDLICREAEKYDKPFFLAGDLNCTPQSEAGKELARRFIILTDTASHTFPADKPQETIDYVAIYRNAAAQNIMKLSSGVLDEPEASDHRPIYVDVLL